MTPEAAAQHLQVSLDIDKAELKKLYKILVLKYHPDRNKHHNASEIFILVKEAYETLLAYTPELVLQHVQFNPEDFVTFGNSNGTISTGDTVTFTWN